jgi:hypothetical protein
MTDPLRPFAAMIRALWLARAQGKGAARSQAATTPVRSDSPRSRPARSFRAQLQGRIAATSAAGSARIRETFVEAVLLWELGEQLALDPDFADLVTIVSDQLAADPAISERLNHALMQLAAGPKASR